MKMGHYPRPPKMKHTGVFQGFALYIHVFAPRCFSQLFISRVRVSDSTLRGNEKWGLKGQTIWIRKASAGSAMSELRSCSWCQFVMEVFWKLVKGELRQQLMSYAEDFNVDLMHQGDQKVEQYTNTNRVTWAIVTPKSEDVSHSIPIYLPLLVSPILTAHPWMARIAVTLYVTCRCLHPIG